MATQVAQSIPTKRLAAAILSTDSSFTVNNILDWGGVALTSADFGTRAFGCFRNAANTQIEFFEFDPTTIASSAITIIARGLDYKGGSTDGVETKYTWPANSTLVELGGNVPALFEQYIDKTADETIAGIKTFSSSPIVPTPTTATQVANKSYVDGVAIAGAPDASTTVKGIFEEATTAETDAGTAAGGTSARLAVNPAGLAASIYATRLPSADEKAALVGQSGTAVSASNKLVDNADVASAATASKIARRNATGDVTVPTTPSASTDAASKSYVDIVDAKVANTVNASETVSTWFTYEMPFLTYTASGPTETFIGWTTNGYLIPSATYKGASGLGYLDLSNNGGSLSNYLPGTGSTQIFRFSANKKWKMKFRALVTNSTNIWGLGIVDSGTAGKIYTAETDTSVSQMRLVWNSANIYLANSNGTNYTSSTVSGITRTDWNLYELVYDGTSLYCYVNGTLKATNSTYIPTSASNCLIHIGGDTVSKTFATSPITFSLEQ